MSIVELTQKNFDKTVADNNLVVIDFWAEWCGPCRSFTKVIEELDKKYPEVTFGAIDIEKEKELAEDFNIMSVPAIMILRERVVVFAQTGALPLSAMIELIEQAKKLDQQALKKMQEGQST
jgi:thioredoxin 1